MLKNWVMSINWNLLLKHWKIKVQYCRWNCLSPISILKTYHLCLFRCVILFTNFNLCDVKWFSITWAWISRYLFLPRWKSHVRALLWPPENCYFWRRGWIILFKKYKPWPARMYFWFLRDTVISAPTCSFFFFKLWNILTLESFCDFQNCFRSNEEYSRIYGLPIHIVWEYRRVRSFGVLCSIK